MNLSSYSHTLPQAAQQTYELSNSIVEISKSALLHNIVSYRTILNPRALLAPVIKSNAYGHGMLEVGALLNAMPEVDYLCVVSLSETLKLRAAGIDKPLLVLSIIDAPVAYAVEYHIDLVVYDLATVQEIASQAQQLGKKAQIHVKVDTGLSRLGVLYDQACHFIETCARIQGIEVRGIFTHFAASERSDLSFSHLQLERFLLVIESLRKKGIEVPLVHCASSAAITALPESHGTFARLGIGTYGLWPSVESKIRMEMAYPHFYLRPILTWKTQVIARKTVPAGSFIGYDCTYQTAAPTEIAILPVGYYDGYDRRLSNQGLVNIKGALFPVRGRIAMNLCIVDVTTHPEIAPGDEVTLLGSDPLLSAEAIAQQCGTIHYEITTRINAIIERRVVE